MNHCFPFIVPIIFSSLLVHIGNAFRSNLIEEGLPGFGICPDCVSKEHTCFEIASKYIDSYWSRILRHNALPFWMKTEYAGWSKCVAFAGSSASPCQFVQPLISAHLSYCDLSDYPLTKHVFDYRIRVEENVSLYPAVHHFLVNPSIAPRYVTYTKKLSGTPLMG